MAAATVIAGCDDFAPPLLDRCACFRTHVDGSVKVLVTINRMDPPTVSVQSAGIASGGNVGKALLDGLL
jgi:hypothetical protein